MAVGHRSVVVYCLLNIGTQFMLNLILILFISSYQGNFLKLKKTVFMLE